MIPGIYRNSSGSYEVRVSKRDHWYAIRLEPDGSTTYLAQNVTLQESERQPSGCSQCNLPVWHRGLCGMCLSADAVRRTKVTAR